MACSNDKIALRQMPQLAEAAEPDDDWTGVTDAAVRRKRQNRLHSRAFPRRKALEATRSQPSQTLSRSRSQTRHPPGPRAITSHSSRREEDEVQGEEEEAESKILVPCWIEAHQSITPLPVSKLANWLRGRGPRRAALLPYTSMPVTSLDQVTFPLSSDHLITLLQYNVLRGCLENRRLLTDAFRHWNNAVRPVYNRTSTVGNEHEAEGRGDEEWSSTALTVLPSLGNDDDTAHLFRVLPRSLHPMLLQRTVPHAAWIDILPHPVLRDNLILATTSAPSSESTSASGTTNSKSFGGVFDADALWTDTVGDLFFEADSLSSSLSSPSEPEVVEESEGVIEAVFAGGIVWSPPWDVSGWELSEGFWRKWGWMMEGVQRRFWTRRIGGGGRGARMSSIDSSRSATCQLIRALPFITLGRCLIATARVKMKPKEDKESACCARLSFWGCGWVNGDGLALSWGDIVYQIQIYGP